jgi:hypothetical protein
MTPWVDIRLVRDDLPEAVAIIANSELVTHCVIDFHPPAAAPEVELTLEVATAVPVDRVLRALRHKGLTILATRSRAWARR